MATGLPIYALLDEMPLSFMPQSKTGERHNWWMCGFLEWCRWNFETQKALVSSAWTVLKIHEIIIGGSNCVLILGNQRNGALNGALKLKRSWSCRCGLLNYFPIDELGKVKQGAWELCFISGGFILFVAKRTRGGERDEDFLLLQSSHRWLTLLALHLSTRAIKSQGSIMTFTLSSVAVNALPLLLLSHRRKHQ